MNKHKYILLPTNEINNPEIAMRSSIDQNELNSLINSIDKVGLIQPITVTKRNGQYEVVTGHRRLEACRALNIELTPCIITTSNAGNTEAMKFHENFIREDVNIVDEGRYYANLMDKLNISPEELANMIHKSNQYVRSRVNICEMQPEIINALYSGKIKYQVAEHLTRLKDDNLRQQYLQYSIDNGATGPQVAKWVKDILEIDSQEDIPPDSQEDKESIVKQPESLVVCEACNDNIKFTQTRLVRLCKQCLDKTEL